MVRRFFYSIVFFPLFGFCAWGDLFNGPDDPVMNHHVNVMSRKLQLGFVDHVIRGAVPLSLERSYSNYNSTKLDHAKWEFTEEWSFYSHTHLFTDSNQAEIIEPSGQKITYSKVENVYNGVLYRPIVNADKRSEVMSYRLNTDNNQLIFHTKEKSATLYLSNGGYRTYKAKPKRFVDKVNIFFSGIYYEYLLAEEVSSSGQKTVYTYDDKHKRLIIEQTNLSKKKKFAILSLTQMSGYPAFKIQAITSDGEKFEYHGKEIGGRCHLEKVVRPATPIEKYTYKKNKKPTKCWLETISMKDRNALCVNHDPKTGLVNEVIEGGQKVASFVDTSTCTEVTDCNGYLTKYYYFQGGLSSIYFFDKMKNTLSSEKFFWENGNLIAKVFCDSKGNGIYSKTFVYDEFKNVIQETVYGNISGTLPSSFTVNDKGVLEGAESFSKWYKYDKRHLLREEREEGGLTFDYSYAATTDLISRKRTKYENVVLLTESCTYDNDLLLVEKSSFDDFFKKTERYTRHPNTGLITEIDDGLIKIRNTYNHKNQIIEESNGIGSIFTEYDIGGRVICKMFPCGGKNEYVYDEFSNPIQIKQVGEPWKNIEYDSLNRPIVCEVDGRRSTNTYDHQGRIICEVDYKGATTHFEYNFLGQCIKKTLPPLEDENGESYTPEFIYEYDLQGNVIYEKGPSGAITCHEYNVLGKLIYTIYPDGSRIDNTYYLNGDLKESIDLQGIKTTYKYDIQHRLISKTRGFLEERWQYKGVLLEKYINEAGLATTYEYDAHGRKILENFEGRTKHFHYDQLGHLEKVTDDFFSVVEIHDVEGRIVETSKNRCNRIKYEYDVENRKTKAINFIQYGKAVDQFFYDATGRLTLHIDPLDQPTQFLYEDYARTVIDPVGNRSIERFDTLYKVIEKEKQSPLQETLFLEKFFYDRAGNLKRRYIEEHNIDVIYTYDLMGKVLEEVEARRKVTSYSYDSKGRLKKKTSPDGVFFVYAYDDLSRMTEMKSSDATVWYEYIYEGVYLYEIKDHILQKSIHYSYTEFGEIAQECGLLGFKTSWYYDTYGRTKQVVLPDNSSIEYTYYDCFMHVVSRFDSSGNFLYEHRYTEYDFDGHVREEEIINNLGTITTYRDILQRPYEMDSPFHFQTLEYNAINLVTDNKNSLTKNATYSYDGLNQLTQEEDISYQFDSLGNPKEYEINALNQIVSTPTESFSYDQNGNMTKRKSIGYTYDALHRLREIQYESGKKVTFTYDPLSRLISKETWKGKKLEAKKLYLYDKEFEIGSMNENGEIKELKVLGVGIEGDIGGAIAIELNGEVFAPIHDLQGSLISIVNSSGKIVEKYAYNAFGEEKFLNYINPWRFVSKRMEEGLIFFGFRFYDPVLKRWICPDPLGFSESRNVYLYVLNNPTNRLDLFGLESIFYMSLPSDYTQYSCIGASMPETPQAPNNFYGAYGDVAVSQTTIGEGYFDGEKGKISLQFPADFNFAYTQKEIQQGYFNFFDHVNELISGCEDQCAYVTLMNGMYNNDNDFSDMGEHVSKKFSKKTLIIGLYNETTNSLLDMGRVIGESFRYTTKSMRLLSCVTKTMVGEMEKYAPNAHSLHITHSEGALIFARTYEKSAKEDQERMQKYIGVLGVGGALPIKDKYTKFSLNIYSNWDLVTGLSAVLFSKGCKIKWLKSTSTREQKMLRFIDHGFLGNTYSDGLDEFINEHKRERGGFYEINQR